MHGSSSPVHCPTDIAEIPLNLGRTDWSYYAVLSCGVAPLWLVTPVSICFSSWAFLFSNPLQYSFLGGACLTWSLAEVAFGIYQYHLRHTISGPSSCPPADPQTLQTAFIRLLQSGLATIPSEESENSSDEEYSPERIRRPYSPAEPIVHLEKDDPRAIDFRNKFRTWFGGAPWSHIRKGDVETWMYWSCFNAKRPNELSPHEARTLREGVKLLEMRCGTKFKEGRNPDIKTMCLTTDEIDVRHRPLAWYLFVRMLNQTLRAVFTRLYDVRFEKWGDLEYMIRIPKNYDPGTGPLPILFFHGLGLGLAQYHKLLKNILLRSPDHPVIVPIQPHISQDIFHSRFLQPMCRWETVDLVVGLLDHLGFSRNGVMCMSHSNGSYAHAWMLKEQPDMIKRSCFVDPVTFCSWEGDVCYNFVYRPSTTGFHVLLRYFVATELGVANLIQRRFDWTSNSLFFEEIPDACDSEKTIYIVGGQDSILSAERVCKYLRSHGVREGLKYFPKHKHGEALLAGGKALNDVFTWIEGGTLKNQSPVCNK